MTETASRTRRRWTYMPPLVEGVRWQPKIISGTLDLMPAGPPWNLAEYEDWLALFDKACRIYYRLPSVSEDTPDA